MPRDATSPNTPNIDAEIDFLDILIIISRQFKLILLCTVLGAAIGWLWAYTQPVIYNSTSSLNVEFLRQNEKTPRFKSEVIASLVNLNQEFRDLLHTDDWGAHASITASVNPKDRLVIITTSSETPQRSHELNELVLKKIYAYTIPQGKKYEYAQAIIENEKLRIGHIEAAVRKLKTQENSTKDTEGKIIENLLDYKIDRELNIIRLYEFIEGITSDNVIQTPNIPSQPADIKKRTKTILSALCGMVIAALWALISHFVRIRYSDLYSQKKLKTIVKNMDYKSSH